MRDVVLQAGPLLNWGPTPLRAQACRWSPGQGWSSSEQRPRLATLTCLLCAWVQVAKGFAANLTRLTNYSQSFVINPDSSNPIDPFAFGLVLLCTLVLSLGSKEYAFMVSGAKKRVAWAGPHQSGTAGPVGGSTC